MKVKDKVVVKPPTDLTMLGSDGFYTVTNSKNESVKVKWNSAKTATIGQEGEVVALEPSELVSVRVNGVVWKYMMSWLEPVGGSAPTGCTCPIMVIMSTGCRCGQMERERQQ